jgi:hypothetical protein
MESERPRTATAIDFCPLSSTVMIRRHGQVNRFAAPCRAKVWTLCSSPFHTMNSLRRRTRPHRKVKKSLLTGRKSPATSTKDYCCRLVVRANAPVRAARNP